MEFVGTRRIYAPGDLVDFIACEHQSVLSREIARGERVRPDRTDEEELTARKGDEHERAHLHRLIDAGVAVTEIPRATSFSSRSDAARETIAAMRAGAEAIHGATFVDVAALGDGWSGVADFAIKTDGASAFGDYHYEIWDAKLARTAKPSAIVQTCMYSELLTSVQQVMPARVHLILGDGRVETFRTDEALPYVRAARARFLAAATTERRTYPEPVAHCGRCRFLQTVCAPRGRADDHLSFSAGIRRSQIVKLHASGIATMAALAVAPDGAKPRKLGRSAFARLRAQAALQVAARSGAPRYELLEPQDGCGFGRLPEPDPGDLYFDMEGDPFYEDGGLEYLFGVAGSDATGGRTFTYFSGHDRREERHAFEAFIDHVTARRAVSPLLHVYHYASYEESALKRLAAQHGTREAEVDTLLRERVLVDLFDVVRQALRASFESYSLKKIEQFYRGVREETITSAIGSVVMYERFLATRDAATFDEIVRYNRDDCFSTLDLHRWLLARREEAEEFFEREIPWRAQGEPAAQGPQADEADGLAAELIRDGAPEFESPDDRARALAAHLLSYHRREAKPAWWAFFDHGKHTSEELIDDAEAIGGLTLVDAPPELFKSSLGYLMRFPPQEHKIKPGSVYEVDEKLPAPRAAGRIERIDDVAGELVLVRRPGLADTPLPRALCPPGPIRNDAQRKALARFGRALIDDDCAARYRACRDILRADPPRWTDRLQGATVDDGATTPEKVADLVTALDASYLFVQGPPGAGKTWAGARAIVTLIERGLRVGVASTSHKAIHNLLRAIEDVALARGVRFRGLKKTTASAESAYTGALVTGTDDASACADPAVSLVAGTAWLFADAKMDETLDVLAIDEAGQVALADAIAMGTAARSILLLGDPMQLAQVAQGTHPGGAGASVLAHLLGERDTVLPARGLFLPRSYRMHENICRYVSTLAYDGRLTSDSSCARRRVEAGAIGGAGLRYLPVPHEGNVTSSIEEAGAIVDAVAELFHAGTVTDQFGTERPLAEHDVLVVSPYNAQVRCLRETLDRRGFRDVRAGTVDKFQGQEAPVVFFSMASSRGDELPRGIDFLFDRRRLNVAVSRAQVLAILVCSPALLETQATSVDALMTIGALCRLAQEAMPLRGRRGAPPEQLAFLV